MIREGVLRVLGDVIVSETDGLVLVWLVFLFFVWDHFFFLFVDYFTFENFIMIPDFNEIEKLDKIGLDEIGIKTGQYTHGKFKQATEEELFAFKDYMVEYTVVAGCIHSALFDNICCK